jgi:ABC-type branched-subunit amino acid transport system substrate-binding protein/transcriptional regulator with XRE-family HTH domain
MVDRPSFDPKALRKLRIARCLSQQGVAERLKTNASTVSRWERSIATPSLYYQRKLAELFGVDPQELLSDLNSEKEVTPETTVTSPEQEIGVNHSTPTSDESQTMPSPPPASGETTESSQSEPAMVGGPHVLEQSRPISPNDPSRPPFQVKAPLRILIVVIVVIGGVFVLPFLLPKSSTDLFPPLCSGNFQSTNTTFIPTPATGTSPDGEPIGLSKGEHIFDLQRPNPNAPEVQDKLQAAQDWVDNPQGVVSSLENAIRNDPADAEAQIYLENWEVLGSNHPHITLAVGVNFALTTASASRGTLQASFTAQKECNNQNQQDSSKTQIVLMIANIGGNTLGDSASSAKFVTDQIADQAAKDPTIVGVMGWPSSSDSINVNHDLRIRGSHLPMISPSSSSDELGRMSNFFCVCPKNSEQARRAADFLLKTQHKKRIAILYDSTTSLGNNLKDDFTEDIPNNMGVPAGYKGGDPTTLQDALNNVLAQKPDAIFFAGYVSDFVGLLKAISATSSANLLIVGGAVLAITNSYPNPLPDLQNVYFTAFASPNEWDGINPKPLFFRDYKTNFGTDRASNGLPGIDEGTMLSYDALLTLLHGAQQVLSKQSTITPSDLTQALKQVTVTSPLQGITGRIAFESNGDQDPSKMIFVEHIDRTHLVIDEKHGCLRAKYNCIM